MKFFLSLSPLLYLGSLVCSTLHADNFPGFSIDFVEVKNEGNPADSETGMGAVGYDFRMGKFEVSRAMIDSYNSSSGGPALSLSDMSIFNSNGGGRPASGLSWNEAARFVNWLNTSQGFHEAYQFTSNGSQDQITLWNPSEAWSIGGSNLYRHRDAHYFLPSENEWYKSAYFDPDGSVYFDYQVGSDDIPTSVGLAGGTSPGTIAYAQNEPVDATNAGGLSPYGTMAQGGNISEWMESAEDGSNDSISEFRTFRGGTWSSSAPKLKPDFRDRKIPTQSSLSIGFRVASISLPEITVQDSDDNVLIHESSSVDLGGGQVGVYSETETITFCNTGMMTLEVDSVTVSGGAAADYTLAGSVGATTLAPGECQTFTVTFSPSAEGFRPSSLLISSNDSDQSPYSIGLTGIGGVNLDAATFSQDAYIKASDTAASDQFGYAVAISNNTLVVGAREEKSLAQGVNQNPNGPEAFDVGAAYVYVLNAQAQWKLEATLKASNGAEGHQFGRTVDIEGDTIVVGSFSQSAFVFVRNNGVWTEQAILQRNNSEGSGRFGYSVSLSGKTIVVGAPADAASPPGLVGGSAYVFQRSGNNWIQQQFLKASDAMDGDQFGSAVGISENIIVVGAPWQGSIARSGAAYVFERNSSNNWTEKIVLKAFDQAQNKGFGNAVAIDQSALVIGAPSLFGEAGSAYAYVRDSSGDWELEGHFPSTEINFGESVAIRRNRILIGSPGNFQSPGAAFLFEKTNGTWSQQDCIKASNPDTGDGFGTGVTLSDCLLAIGAPSEDSNAILVGGNQANNDASGSGAAYVFSASGGGMSLSYEEAAATAGLTGQGALPFSIPFGDNVPNLLKYAFNMDLSGPDFHWMESGSTSGLPCGAIVEEAGQTYWRFEYVERRGCSVFYTPLQSMTLQPASFWPLAQIRTESPINSSWKRVTLWEPYNPATQPRNFFQVEVELP